MEKIPAHIGIIPDGNRRFAKRLMENPSKGHEWGVGKIKSLFDWCKELGVRTVTIYSLSIENFKKRDKTELDFLFNLARKELDDIINNENSFVYKNNVKINFIGRLDLLPKDLLERMERIKKMTNSYSDYTINLALAYGGRQEIIDASKKISEMVLLGQIKPEEIDENVFKHNLYTNGQVDPDLIIRTGAEKRISNFMVYQAAYSEFVFLDVFWPEFSKDDFFSAVKSFSDRDRRFGQ